MLALARGPGPNRLLVALIPSLPAIGPLTTIMMVAPECPEATWWRPNSGAASALTAAAMTGMYSDLQPAMTAFAATFSAVTETLRDGMSAITVVGLNPAAATMSSTRPR